MEGFARCSQAQHLSFLPLCHRAHRAQQWHLSSVVAHATHDGTRCPARIPGAQGHVLHASVPLGMLRTMGARVRRRASLGAQGRVPHTCHASLGHMDKWCMLVHVPAHQGCVPGRIGRPGPPGQAAHRLDLCGMCRQRRVGACGGGQGTWGSAGVC